MAQKPTVIVLSTLHKFHDMVPAYSYATLLQVLEDLRPDVLAVELQEIDIQERRPQAYKTEYQTSVYPYLDRYHPTVCAMEPNEPLYSELGTLYQQAENELQQASPQAYKELEKYSNDVFFGLLKTWDSVAAVNSPATDQGFEEKHRRQSALMGAKEEHGWNAWNEHFLLVITKAAKQHPGKLIVALAGVEHGYWLRKRLAAMPDIVQRYPVDVLNQRRQEAASGRR